MTPGLLVAGAGADSLRTAVDQLHGDPDLVLGHFAQLARLASELLRARRSVSDRDEVAGAAIELGQNRTRVNVRNVLSNALEHTALVRLTIDLTIDIAAPSHAVALRSSPANFHSLR
jgi:hypothetical protein